ncbi:hypothetical protein MHU86_23822 [Fragilaria crotonensis]|nr:hypothetical protein MHU86_23822 [Fragilaria crotonensis]
MAGGRGRAGRRQRGGGAGRSGRGARGGPPPRPPPPPPPPPPPAPPDHAAAAGNSVEDSPATRTRRQLMLALQAGSNSADCHDGGRGSRLFADTDGSEEEDDDGEDDPAYDEPAVAAPIHAPATDGRQVHEGSCNMGTD